MVLPVHQLTPYLRVRITTDDRSLVIAHRRSVAGLVPLWTQRVRVPLNELASADVRTRVRMQCVVAAIALAAAIFLLDLPVVIGVGLGILAALELLLALAPRKAIHVERTDGRTWTISFCRVYAFDASLALEDAQQRRDATAPTT
jgi:hypothetical protein